MPDSAQADPHVPPPEVFSEAFYDGEPLSPGEIRERVVRLVDSWILDATNPETPEHLLRHYLGGVRFGRDLLQNLSLDLAYGSHVSELTKRQADEFVRRKEEQSRQSRQQKLQRDRRPIRYYYGDQ